MKKETLENKVVRLALGVNKLIDRIEKLEKIIDWEVAHTTMRGVVSNAKCIMEEDKEILRSLADSDFHETPKQRWMRENLRPGEVYAGIILAKYEDKYDYHLVASVEGTLVGRAFATEREQDLMRANLSMILPYVRRIPVEYP